MVEGGHRHPPPFSLRKRTTATRGRPAPDVFSPASDGATPSASSWVAAIAAAEPPRKLRRVHPPSQFDSFGVILVLLIHILQHERPEQTVFPICSGPRADPGSHMDRFKRTAAFLTSSVVERETDPFCRNGPQGLSHKRGLSPFLLPSLKCDA